MKVLGLDIGTTSIGWALIETDSDGNAKRLVDAGVRIVPLTTDEETAFGKGQTITTTKDRTLKRAARRNNQRYKLRKYALREKLKSLGMLPSESLFDMTALDLYTLRNKAVSERCTLEEIGRILFHLNQRRGYKSTRGAQSEDEETDSQYLEKIQTRKSAITELGITIGQYFYQKLSDNTLYRIKQEVFPRECYIDEYNKICATQSQYYPDILTQEVIDSIRDEIIYYQRRLKSQKHLVSECPFEKHHKVSPKSAPIFQVCKIWEQINNIVITSKTGEKFLLSDAERQDLFDFLQLNPKISNTDLLKRYDYTPTRNFKLNYEGGIQGNLTRDLLFRAITTHGSVVESIFNYDVLATPDTQPYFKLWHLVYSVEDSHILSQSLATKFGFNESQCAALCKLDLKRGGFGNKSTRAMRKIMPHLIAGLKYSEACEAAGYNHSNSKTKEQNEARHLASHLVQIPKNTLKNPVVEKILNQVVNLVNAIIDNPQLGKPDEIRIELARELKQNAKKRRGVDQDNRARKSENDKIVNKLQSEYGIKRVTSKLIEKYKLYQEWQGMSAYTGKQFTIEQVLNGDQVDIDHIIPKSRMFNDSFENKVLTERKVNEDKGNRTAYDYLKSLGESAFEDFVNRVSDRKGISETKRGYLLMPVDKIPQDFISRQLKETQYIAREAKGMLESICRNVYSTSGSVTSLLRHAWGLDEVLKNINRPRYELQGAVQTENTDRGQRVTLEGWSKRMDHRHHAIDAIVIACTKQGYIQRLNNLNQEFDSYEDLKQARYDFPQPWDTIYQDTVTVMSGILISFKSGKRVGKMNTNKATGRTTLTPRGQLHNETVYGKNKKFVKVPLNTKFIEVERIAYPNIKALVVERLAQFDNDPKKAFKALDKKPIYLNEDKKRALEYVTLFEDVAVKRYDLDGTFTEKVIASIVDVGVRKAVLAHLKANGGDPKKAFTDLENNPVYQNKEKGIRIRSVKCDTGMGNLKPLHLSANGLTFSMADGENVPNAQPVDYVSLSNNHHLAVYINTDGERIAEMVSFWEAVERKRNGEPVIKHDHPSGATLQFSIQVNEMVVFDMTTDDLNTAIDSNRYDLISPHLYRVQKMSKSANGTIDIWFRNHLETTLDDSDLAKQQKRFLRIKSLKNLNLKKVKLNHIGKVSLS